MALTSKLEAIGDAIRAKGGTTDSLSLDGMVTAIEAIPSGGEDTAVALIERTITEANYPTVTKVSDNAFSYCTKLTTVNTPKCTSVGSYAFDTCSALTSIDLPACINVVEYAFYKCSALTTVNLPVCTSVGNQAFFNCSALTTMDLPKCTSVGSNAFQYCSALTSIDLPVCTSVGNYAFMSCSALTTVILRNTSGVVTLGGSSALPRTASNLSIYVPDTLVDSYKTATNWVTYADQIKPLSELPTEV